MFGKYMTRYGIEAIRRRIAGLEQQYHESLERAGGGGTKRLELLP